MINLSSTDLLHLAYCGKSVVAAIETFETVFSELHKFGIDQLKKNQLQLGRNVRQLLEGQGLMR